MRIEKGLKGPCFESGYKALASRGIAVIGMSPGNSYFKQPTIHYLIEFAAKEFGQVYIWTPDLPAAHTYKALGYPDQEAKQKAHSQGNNLKNHSAKAIRTLEKEYTERCFIMDWNRDIEHSQVYQENLAYVKTLYQSNQEFYNDIHEETRRVIEGYSRRLQEATPAALEEGAQYLIKEMAFFLASETLLQSNNVTLLYHRRWQVFEQFFSGYYDGITRNIGLLIVTI